MGEIFISKCDYPKSSIALKPLFRALWPNLYFHESTDDMDAKPPLGTHEFVTIISHLKKL